MAFASKTSMALAMAALLPLGACATAPAPVPAAALAAPVPQYGQARYVQAVQYGRPTPLASTPVALTPVTFTPSTVDAAPLAPPPLLERHDGLLSSPPNDARPGDCYAKVVVPGQPIPTPPPQPRAVWVQSPPWPGQISPTWCIYYLPGAPQPVLMSPERYGWIRVVCDRDATREKIRHVQRRLHDWGDYDGAYDGRYDDTTAKGVVRFQEQRHIDHGGYLSVKTVEALETAPPPPAGPTFYASPIYQAQVQPPVQAPSDPVYPQAAPQIYAAPCCAEPASVAAPPPPPSIIVQRQVLVQRVVQPVYVQQPPVYAPQTVVQRVVQPVYVPQPVYAPQPQPPFGCGQPACTPQPSPCGPQSCVGPSGAYGGGYGGYGPPSAAPRPALLTWPGKTVY